MFIIHFLAYFITGCTRIHSLHFSRYIFDAAEDGDLALSDLSMPFSWIRCIAIFRKAMSHVCHIVTHAALFLWCFCVGVFAMIHKAYKAFLATLIQTVKHPSHAPFLPDTFTRRSREWIVRNPTRVHVAHRPS